MYTVAASSELWFVDRVSCTSGLGHATMLTCHVNQILLMYRLT